MIFSHHLPDQSCHPPTPTPAAERLYLPSDNWDTVRQKALTALRACSSFSCSTGLAGASSGLNELEDDGDELERDGRRSPPATIFSSKLAN